MTMVFITPGTGTYFCGVCIRDNALVRALRDLGKDAVMLPIYLPVLTDEEPATEMLPLFFGGINVFLQQRFALFRRTPSWLDHILNFQPILNVVSRGSGMTQVRKLGEMTVSMLQGEEGKQSKEVEKLVCWLAGQRSVEVIFLSTALQIGMARSLKRTLSVPVFCFLQGEDDFVNRLGTPYSTKSWAVMRERCGDVDQFIAPSRYFADVMADHLELTPERIRVVPNGINTNGYGPPADTSNSPTIGYLARLCQEKGLGILVDAYILLMKNGAVPNCRLHVAGTVTASDGKYIKLQQEKLMQSGLSDPAEFRTNLSREGKADFLRSLTVLSVPAKYGEAFGLYVLEAMASGVPVVQPNVAAFPELVEATGGGVLYQPNTPEALAEALQTLLNDPDKAQSLGLRGRTQVLSKYSIQSMSKMLIKECSL